MQKNFLALVVGVVALLPQFTFGERNEMEKEVQRLINAERGRAGVVNLVSRRGIADAARAYAEVMAEQQSIQEGLDGRTLEERLNFYGYRAYLWEDVPFASRVEPTNTPEGAVTHLLRNPRQRAALLDPRFLDIGVGVRVGANEKVYFYILLGTVGVPID